MFRRRVTATFKATTVTDSRRMINVYSILNMIGFTTNKSWMSVGIDLDLRGTKLTRRAMCIQLSIWLSLSLCLGCHTGHVTFYVAEHFQPRQIVGLDIDQQLVQQARHQLWNRLQAANSGSDTTGSHASLDQDHLMHSHADQQLNKRYPFNLRFQQVWLGRFLCLR